MALLSAGMLDQHAAFAQPTPGRVLAQASENLASELWILEDPGGALSIDNIRAGNTPEPFRLWDASLGDLNLSYSRSAWWVRIRLARDIQAPERWILNIPYAFNKFIDLHTPDGETILTGHGRPLANRPVLSPHFAFPVRVSDEPRDYYFRVSSNYAVSFPLVAWQPDAYAQYALRAQALQAAYHGALLALVLYALFIGLSLRDARFGLFSLYGLALSLAMLAGNGWGGVLVWANHPAFDEMASGVFLSFTAASLLLLAMRVIEASKTLPRLVYLMMVWGAIAASTQGLAMLVCLGQPEASAFLLKSLLALGLGVAVLVSIAVWRACTRPFPGHWFFVASWLAVATGAVVASFRVAGWLPTNVLTSYAVQISTSIEMVLLSVMIIQLVRSERRNRVTEQAQLIDTLKQQEQRLEREVAERTRELLRSAQSERKTLAEYLRFAALVSHEFRNGLNVISAQSDLLNKLSPDAAVGARTAVIRQHVERLARMTENWLRSDQLLKAPEPLVAEAIDCRQWLASVITAEPDGHKGHRIEWHVDPGAARIWADRDALETVLMNLLSNACKYSEPGSRVSVRFLCKTGRDGVQSIGLQVQDVGAGIDAALHEKVFERYFRIQPEGQVSGTGLGLSFVKQIVEQHGGEVELDSLPGRGSTFTAWFPDRH